MLLYVLICLSLSLTGVAGLQMMYMFYLETVDRQRKKHLAELEHECKHLRNHLLDAEKLISEQRTQLQKAGVETGDEVWAEVIEEH